VSDVGEAPLEQGELGLVPKGEGWFIVNTGDLEWETVEGGGTWSLFGAPDAPSEQLGIGIHVLPKGESSGMYHRESTEEGFLVLRGECLLIVEGQERRMKPWDYFRCAPGTDHITIGASDEPCAILMVGARAPDATIHYPRSELAAKYGASAKESTDEPREAYAGRPPFRPARSMWP
jgi:uncharacterized cupin superfamily protein